MIMKTTSVVAAAFLAASVVHAMPIPTIRERTELQQRSKLPVNNAVLEAARLDKRYIRPTNVVSEGAELVESATGGVAHGESLRMANLDLNDPTASYEITSTSSQLRAPVHANSASGSDSILPPSSSSPRSDIDKPSSPTQYSKDFNGYPYVLNPMLSQVPDPSRMRHLRKAGHWVKGKLSKTSTDEAVQAGRQSRTSRLKDSVKNFAAKAKAFTAN